MRLSRIYHDSPIEINSTVLLDPNQGKHLVQVLRLKIGHQVALFTPQGGDFIAEIVGIHKAAVNVHILKAEPRESTSPLKLHLGQGLARGEKMDFVIQKSVELGVTEITPLLTEYTNVKLDPKRAEQRLRHWQQIALHACEQCGRTCLAQINPPQDLNTWLAENNTENNDENNKGIGLILEPGSPSSLATLPLNIQPNQKLSLLIGPEGGFSIEEVILAQKQGFIAASLGPRILRTETAALSSLSILQARFGDFR